MVRLWAVWYVLRVWPSVTHSLHRARYILTLRPVMPDSAARH